jgi:hypothetical protein
MFGWYCFSGVDVPGDSFHSLATGCPYLRKLFLTALRTITDRDLEPFIEHCPALEQVDLMGVHGITSDICVQLVSWHFFFVLECAFKYQICMCIVSAYVISLLPPDHMMKN